MKKVVNIIAGILIVLNISLLIFQLINNNKNYKVKNDFEFKLVGESYISISLDQEYEDEGAIIIDGDKKTEITTTDTIENKIGKYILKYNYDDGIKSSTLYRIVEIKDNKAPVIKLKGNKQINLYVGDKYKEPGYTVSDDSNEDLKDKVVITNEVNLKKAGSYKIKYEVSDSSGNSTSIERKVIVSKKKITKSSIAGGYSSIATSKQSETRAVTKESVVEKDTNKVNNGTDVSNYTNTVKSMTWINNGIRLNGYVQNGNGSYELKLCNESLECTQYSVTPNGANYSADLNLTKLNNGVYTIKLVTNNAELDLADGLSDEKKIVRSKKGNKLITVLYNNSIPTIKIENFAYQYDVLIDVGHGGSDQGASNSYMLEKTINLTQSLYEKKRFEDHGLRVLITRTDDSYGLMMGASNLPNIRRRALAVGYYGVVSKIVYSNHHNSTNNTKASGFELIMTNQGNFENYKIEYQIASEWSDIYPNLDNHIRIYGRNYDTDAILSKERGQVYNIKNYYAMQRIPYELYDIYTTTYEGCYLSNLNDYNWYIKNWQTLSEIKIKNYVTALGIQYKE